MTDTLDAAAGILERPVPTCTWHSFDLRTLRRGPELTVQELPALSRMVGEPTDVSGLAVLCYDTLAETSDDGLATTAGAVPGWQEATLPGRTMLVALNESQTPIWGGMVLRRRSDAGAWVTLDLVTLEGYFDRRYVKDHDYVETTQGAIVSGVITGDVIPTGVPFTVDANSPTKRERTYFEDEDKTVLSVLQDLMGVEGGPEFTVDLQWADGDQTRLDAVVRVRDRIGAAHPLPARFDMPGPVTAFTYTEDYGADNGANDVLATSSGEGSLRPTSQHQVATDLLAAGWARFERRFTPSTSIVETDTLDDHARAELAETRDGLTQLTLVAHLDTAPRVGDDFDLGDDVTAVLTCPRFPAYIGPDGGWVPGFTRTLRCIGWEIDYQERQLTPTLVEVD